MEKAVGEWICGLRASANGALRQYEPVILVIFPFVASLLSLVVGRLIHLFLQLAPDNGFKGAFLIILMNNIRLIPGLRGYIEREKGKVKMKNFDCLIHLNLCQLLLLLLMNLIWIGLKIIML
jgi:sphinganine-1-phosphate aldolase